MFREIILKIKRQSGLSTKRLADEIGVSKYVIDNLLCVRYGQQEPKFSDGVVILMFARELGVRV